MTLPDGVHIENLGARYNNGLLEIVMPFEGRKSFKVPVEIQAGSPQKERADTSS